ncbi:NAD(P)-dependent oxidoreductase [Nitrogeniibacter mangrovi]|uniref:NAD(P)-dependent oxidoreductase n=1 Tax=Nitrogeniibacter mangrovi TaxID=2016596 RepID=A0A6C1B043_9RHOO|nr:NAD(P)-dependent oxidoreductase [Nitrogeniibacter mangrovi]QID16976.1 NAD(P)-dependent oxidoreductase [Nitrogeniibacter mangrovi]
MKSVLITGANGFVGSALVRRLDSEGWHVIPSARKRFDDKTLVLDFESEQFYSQVNCLPRVDAIVHLATKVGFGDQSIDELYVSNVAATAALVSIAKRMGAQFVFSSAALIAGLRTSRIGINSDDRPEIPYMLSKQLGEQLVRASGVSASILRIGGIFGLEGPDHLGINRSIKSVLNGSPPLLHGSGEAVRNYIYVKDVAEAIVYALNNRVEGTHLVAGREPMVVSQMLQTICDVLHPGMKPEQMPGDRGFDQIVEPSPTLPDARSFKAALLDIANEVCQ